AAIPAWEDHISKGSCSTHPGLGKYWVNSFWATETILPFLSKTTARELVVPWSNAKIYFSIKGNVNLYSDQDNKICTLIFKKFFGKARYDGWTFGQLSSQIL